MKGRTFSDYYNNFASFPSYFSRLCVSLGEEMFVINMNTLEIEKSNYEIKQKIETLNVKEYVWSNMFSNARVSTIKVGDMILQIRSYDNKDIRNGFSIKNAHYLTNRSGALENTIYTEDMKLEELDSILPIEQICDRISKGTREEEYLELENNKVIVEHPIF